MPVCEIGQKALRSNRTATARTCLDGRFAMRYKLTDKHEVLAHPFADVLPLLPESELKCLTLDIKENGQQVPVVLVESEDKEWLVLDGRNRLLSCERLKVAPTWQLLDSGRDLAAYIWSVNFQRRQQTREQRIMAVARLVNIKKKGRPKKNASIEAFSQAKAVRLSGFSRPTIQRAIAILDDSVLAAAVDAGTVAVSDAYSIKDAEDDAKRRAVTAVRNGEAATLKAALERCRTDASEAASASEGGSEEEGGSFDAASVASVSALEKEPARDLPPSAEVPVSTSGESAKEASLPAGPVGDVPDPETPGQGRDLRRCVEELGKLVTRFEALVVTDDLSVRVPEDLISTLERLVKNLAEFEAPSS